jgi:hypothetical protein
VSDRFAHEYESVSGPSAAPVAVVPDDIVPLASIPKGLYVGTAGNLAVRGLSASQDVLFKNVPAGSILPVRAKFVRATGTTAQDIIAL